MKRARSSRQHLRLEPLESRDLMAGITTPLIAPTTRLPAPDIVPDLVAQPVQPISTSLTNLRAAFPWHNLVLPRDVDNDSHVTAGDALQVINIINAFGPMKVPDNVPDTVHFADVDADNNVTAGDALSIINTINSRGAATSNSPLPATLADPELDDSEPEFPGSNIAINDPVSPSQLEKLSDLLDPTAMVDEALAQADEQRLSLIDVDAVFEQMGLRELGVAPTTPGSTDSQTGPVVGNRGQVTTKYGTASSLFGEVFGAGTALAPVGYKEGDGVYDATKGETAKEYEGTTLGRIGSSIAGQNNTPTGQALSQAIEEMDTLEAEDTDDSGTSDTNSTDSNSSETTSTGDGSTAERVDMGDFTYYFSDDRTVVVLEFDDGTIMVHNYETDTTITLKPDGTVIEEDANGNKTEYKPTTPADDQEPLPEWAQKQLDQWLAEMRAAAYTPGGEDIDWGDGDSATQFYIPPDATIRDIMEILLGNCGGTQQRPRDLDQGEFQQPDQGDVDPNPNDGN